MNIGLKIKEKLWKKTKNVKIHLFQMEKTFHFAF